MKIELCDVAKRYRREWVLRKVNLTFYPGRRYALTGPNGSGKSTLLKIISGHLTPTAGRRIYLLDDRPADIHNLYPEVSYAAPYVDLIEAFTLEESLRFHRRFKPFREGLAEKDLLDILGLPAARRKEVRHFSSGMKQRLKLALAICSRGRLLLLDEPTTNLDRQGAQWYRQLLERFAANATLIVASNETSDYDFCDEIISVPLFK
jgi:ABC-2 type transport system ATP-binding protein